MADKKDRSLGDATGASQRGDPDGQETRKNAQRGTAGTNRDFDETGEAENQGHGHPREERERASKD